MGFHSDPSFITILTPVVVSKQVFVLKKKANMTCLTCMISSALSWHFLFERPMGDIILMLM